MESEVISPPPRRKWPTFVGIGLAFLFLIGISRAYFQAAPIPEPSPTTRLTSDLPALRNGTWICPQGKRIAAYSKPPAYFPPNHPSPPPRSLKPERCFSTEVEARAAGFEPAGPPPGGELVGGVYFIPRPMSLLDDCRGIATRLEYAIPCPSAIPAPSFGTQPEISCWSDDGSCRGGFLRFSWTFDSPLFSHAGFLNTTVDVSATRSREYFEFDYRTCGEEIASETIEVLIVGSTAMRTICSTESYFSISFHWSVEATYYRLSFYPNFGLAPGSDEEISTVVAVADRLAQKIVMVP